MLGGGLRSPSAFLVLHCNISKKRNAVGLYGYIVVRI